MTNNKKISLGIAVTVGIGAAIGTALLIKKLVQDSDAYKNYSQANDAMGYLKEKYGDEALAGKKIMIVDENKPVTKAKIARDVIDYNLQ